MDPTFSKISIPPIPSKKRKILIYMLVIFTLIMLTGAYFFYVFFVGSSSVFGEGKIVYIEKGQALSRISDNLEDEGVTFFSKLLTITIILQGGENKVVSGQYLFEKKEGIFAVAKRITTGDFQIKPVKITIPEGFTKEQIVSRIKDRIKIFDEVKFLELAKNSEGYLFPETYFLMPDVTAEDALKTFSKTFDEEIAKIKNSISFSKNTFEEIVKMASILEKEVRTSDEKKVVSGILWKRIEIGMPLQVDATLTYERGKTSAELSIDDLEKNSPYNTYTNKGLPPTPISNPGIDSISAAANPVPSPYLFFLTDKDGNVHYGKNFEEHKANKAKYLR